MQKLCKTCFQNQQQRVLLIKQKMPVDYTLRNLYDKKIKKVPNVNNQVGSKKFL